MEITQHKRFHKEARHGARSTGQAARRCEIGQVGQIHGCKADHSDTQRPGSDSRSVLLTGASGFQTITQNGV